VDILRHVLSILILPTTVVVLVPWWILRSLGEHDTRWRSGTALLWLGLTMGVVVFAAGFALFAWCVSLFARVGRGTLAPWDPTQRLVAVGPYRYVRNPMITGVAMMLGGEALLLGSWLIAGWCVVFVLVNHGYFVLFEEPGLVRRFGASYDEYRRAVPRWLPRRIRR
jgi:protein-S-isoprenylcysteine O-methyltransferase Ste14